MPPGAPFAVLADAAAKWPETLGKKAGYHMRGYRLDEKRRPAFLYDFGQVQIEDYPVAVSGEVEGSLRRRLILQAEDGVKNLWFRAWSGTSIEPQSDGSFLAEGKIKLRLQLTDSVKPIMRQSDNKSELLIPVRFSGNKAQLVEEIIW